MNNIIINPPYPVVMNGKIIDGYKNLFSYQALHWHEKLFLSVDVDI